MSYFHLLPVHLHTQQQHQRSTMHLHAQISLRTHNMGVLLRSWRLQAVQTEVIIKPLQNENQ